MPMDKFFIAPMDKESGLDTSLKPWLIPDTAFSSLENAYVFRGRVRKRFGSRWFGNTQFSSRLRVNIGTTDGSGDFTGTVPLITINLGNTDGAGNAAGIVPGASGLIGQTFEIGAQVFTVTLVNGALTTVGVGTGTFNTATGAYTFAGAALTTAIYYYPGPQVTGAIGQAFSVGTTIFTVNALGTNPGAAMLRSDGSASIATYDTSIGNVVIDGATATTTVYYYPALPVMGLITYETGSQLEFQPTIAFDTTFSYQYNNTTVGWERITGEVTPGSSIWTGDNSQFFWGASYNGANAYDYILWVTNYNENETLRTRTFDGTNWDTFYPQVSAYKAGPPIVPGIYLASYLIVVPFKNRLVVFNTWENETYDNMTYTLRNYQNRARYSAVGSAFEANAWRQDIPGEGSGVDCPVNQAIVTVEFIKDRLIVFFENSTWEFVYTGNQIYPFAWQQINEELGAESTFSVIPTDKVAIGVGNVGIMACNGANVERIDTRIPDQVFAIHQKDQGIERVYGIRDYFVEMFYWSFPGDEQSTDFPYPNRVLIYNYKTNTWAFNDDSITVFGYFQPVTGITWDSTTVTWDDDVSWDSGATQALFRQVVAGNQEGYTFIIDANEKVNAPVLQITDIPTILGDVITITCIDHNLRDEDYVYIQGVVATGNLEDINNGIYQVTVLSSTQFNIVYSPFPPVIAGTYQGGGIMSRVSQISISTKEYNFYAKQGMNAAINKVEFMVDTTDAAALCSFDVNYYVSTSQSNLLIDSQPAVGTNCILGQGTLDTFPYALYPYEATSSRKWSPVYINSVGEVISLTIQMNNEQITTVIPILNPDSTYSYTGPSFVDFEIHSMVFYATPSGRLQ